MHMHLIDAQIPARMYCMINLAIAHAVMFKTNVGLKAGDQAIKINLYYQFIYTISW
jgi:hypothetical protein